MVMCFAPDCKHYSEQKICKFFCFPANEQEKNIWVELLRRADRQPSKHSLVCSCHFVDGNRKNRPTIFAHNLKKKFAFVSPEKRKRSVKTTLTTKAVADLTAALEDTTLSSPIEPVPGSSKDTNMCSALEPVPGSSGYTTPTATELDSGPSRSISRLSNASMEAEMYFLRERIDILNKELDTAKARFSFDQVKKNDKYVLMYTGIPTAELFLILFETIDAIKLNYYSGWNVDKISKTDQLFLTLMKLRLNFPHQDLAIRFDCSIATITNIFQTWLYALHEILYTQLMNDIPSRQKNILCLPTAFIDFFNCRIILDCTEVASVVPKNMEKQRLTYSSYKHRNTWKGLIGVAPNGVITYASKLYPGSLSDKKIVTHCGLLEQMKAGDLILADKGFLINDILPEGVRLNIPPFLTTPQFSPSQVAETKRIAKARIHVERAIRRVKCYSILDKIPQYLIPHSSVIFQTCVALTNFANPLIKEVEEHYI